ncbi:MAG: Citrate synthase [Chlamydiales bacterium]|nr:Citrate synthase [Chlamydiales bacterium]MCH9636022.1 Citrate synthase [Chlamydiales bacterium]
MTEEQLETGLRGVPVGYCTTSKVDPEKGLFYRGMPVKKLASWDPERVLYLLFHGKEPSDSELDVFKGELRERSFCHPAVLEHIESLPREGHPMALFSSAILILGMYELKNDWREDCLNLMAKIPVVTACVMNSHAGWGKMAPSKPELGYMENFVHLLNVPGVDKERLTEFVRIYDILHFDHGGGNLSTFVGKAVASGLEDLYGSIAAAMNALAGPLHGRANQECLNFLKEMMEAVGENASGDAVEDAIRKRLANKKLVYGFGHAVLRVEDPRATIQYELGKKYFADHPLIRFAHLVRERGTKVLKENPKIANPFPNVDAISGALLTAAGFGFPEYYTVLFGMSRCCGIATQIVYERCIARDGRGTPIVRPKYIYKGP